jgi:hypothetical protein
MANRVSGKPSRELESEPESTVVIDIDPAELEEVEAIDAPIWEGITDRAINTDLAEVVGIEAIGNGNTTLTPDWNVVDNLAASVGIEMPNGEILHTNEILERRDTDRWELDPQSAEED